MSNNDQLKKIISKLSCTPFPEKDNYQAIWSNFICDSSELFDGIKSIVMLETGRLITKEEFDIKFNSFMCEYRVEKNNLLYLSDCVSIIMTN